MDETLMPRHIDETQFAAVGIAQVDGDAAALLLRQAVGIDAGQGFDQRGLAVVHMAGGADDHAVQPNLPVLMPRPLSYSPQSHRRAAGSGSAAGMGAVSAVPD